MKSDEVKTLLGHEFRIVKHGLAEEQVVALLIDLYNQRDSLLARQQHINSLQTLAEKVVTEANELAEQIKADAKNEAEWITSQAEIEAQEVVSETRAQVRAQSQAEADRLLQKAREEAAAIVKLAKSRISADIKEVRERAERRPENLIGDIVTPKRENGRRDSPPEPLPSPASFSDAGSGRNQRFDSIETSYRSRSVALSKMMERVEEQHRAIDSMSESKAISQPTQDAPVFRGEAKIAIVPPVDTLQMKRLRQKLEDVSYLKVLRTDGCWDEGYIITARIYKPLPVLNMLRGMAEVEKAQLWTDGKKWSDGYYPGWLSMEPKPGGLKGDRLVVKLRHESVGSKPG